MNRLAAQIAPHRRGPALLVVLDHLRDAHPDEYATARGLLDDTRIGVVAVADALTAIAQEDNLGVRVDESAIRRWRKRNA